MGDTQTAQAEAAREALTARPEQSDNRRKTTDKVYELREWDHMRVKAKS